MRKRLYQLNFLCKLNNINFSSSRFSKFEHNEWTLETAAEARKNAIYRINQKCIIATRLRNQRKIAQVALGLEDHLQTGYLPPLPNIHPLDTDEKSLSSFTRHITEKVKEKTGLKFLAAIEKENEKLEIKQELTEREEIRTKIYMKGILIAEALGKERFFIYFCSLLISQEP